MVPINVTVVANFALHIHYADLEPETMDETMCKWFTSQQLA